MTISHIRIHRLNTGSRIGHWWHEYLSESTFSNRTMRCEISFLNVSKPCFVRCWLMLTFGDGTMWSDMRQYSHGGVDLTRYWEKCKIGGGGGKAKEIQHFANTHNAWQLFIALKQVYGPARSGCFPTLGVLWIQTDQLPGRTQETLRWTILVAQSIDWTAL